MDSVVVVQAYHALSSPAQLDAIHAALDAKEGTLGLL